MRKRGKPILIYLNEDEKAKFVEIFAKSSCSSMSDLARNLLLGKPVRVYYRDRAFDEFIDVVLGLRRDLNLLLQRTDWNESEKIRLQDMIQAMHEIHIKVYDYVRSNKQNEKRP